MAADKKTYMRWGVVSLVLGIPAIYITILHLSWGNDLSLLYISMFAPVIMGIIYIYEARYLKFNKISNISLIFCRLAFYTGIVTLLLVPFVFTHFPINYEDVAVVAVVFLLASVILVIVSLFMAKKDLNLQS